MRNYGFSGEFSLAFWAWLGNKLSVSNIEDLISNPSPSIHARTNDISALPSLCDSSSRYSRPHSNDIIPQERYQWKASSSHISFPIFTHSCVVSYFDAIRPKEGVSLIRLSSQSSAWNSVCFVSTNLTIAFAPFHTPAKGFPICLPFPAFTVHNSLDPGFPSSLFTNVVHRHRSFVPMSIATFRFLFLSFPSSCISFATCSQAA